MKKLFLALVIILSGFVMTSNAQTRTSLGEGYTLVNGSGWSVIENDKLQMSIKIEVKKSSQTIDAYEIFCNNEYVKTATKALLNAGITSVVTTAFSSAGSAGTVARVAVSAVAKQAANEIYDSVCEYYK